MGIHNGPSIYLGPSQNALRMLDEYPSEFCRDRRESAIDGAIEILSCPRLDNRYGGFERSQIVCVCEDGNEWPRDAFLQDRQARMREFAKGLVGDGKSCKGWLAGGEAAPSRIRRLLKVPASSVSGRRQELLLHFGNSDYFTLRTVTEISRRGRENTLGGMTLRDIFPARWGETGKPFPENCVPYHASAQGIIVCQEPSTPNKYLVLASANPLGSALVHGWNVTMTEQMMAPEPGRGFTPWWREFTQPFEVASDPRGGRRGDIHIQDTLIRGLREEFGLTARVNYPADPKLLNVCLEEDMYFIAFIFFVPVETSLENLYSLWSSAPDHKEMGVLAAYQIEGFDDSGNEVSGPMRIAELLAKDSFDGGRHLIHNPTKSGLVGPWHITARMRIYLAARHLWGEEIAKYVGLK